MGENEIVKRSSLVNRRELVAVRAFEIQKITQWLKDKVLPALTEQFPDYAGPLADSFGNIGLTLAVVCEETKTADGLVAKMGIIGSAVEDICNEVEEVSSVVTDGVPGDIKKQIVTLIVTESYNLIDKGWDGSEDRINLISFLPDKVVAILPASLSDVVERWVLNLGVGSAINAAVKAWNRFNPEVVM